MTHFYFLFIVDNPSPLSPMNAERSILVEKSPKTPRTKISKTNVVPTATGKRVTITTDGGDGYQRSTQLPDDIPAPDYHMDNDNKLQAPRKVLSCSYLFKIPL